MVRQAFVDRQPMGRLGTPEEMAALAVYLASDESAFSTGQIYLVDGGFSSLGPDVGSRGQISQATPSQTNINPSKNVLDLLGFIRPNRSFSRGYGQIQI